MSTITSESFSSTTSRRDGRANPFVEIRSYWRQFFARAFTPYRPELHYMRGPGPAWHAKHLTLSTSVHSRIVEIRTRKRRK